MVDGLGVGDVGNTVLRDRQHLAEDGIVIVTFAMERGTDYLAAGPEIESRGFVYMKEAETLMSEANLVVQEALADCLEHGQDDPAKLKNSVRSALSDFFWKKTKRRPMILPMMVSI